jgi:ABC-type nickel/cobalt efflux system permease component RcnA
VIPAPVRTLAVTGWLGRFDDGGLEPVLLGLLEDATGSGALQVLALAVALGVGALHALGPGHGKVMVAGYLASSRGRLRDAVALGVVVALLHTGSVLVLGIVFHLTNRVLVGPALEGTLSAISAVAVTAVGAVLLLRAVRRRRVAAPLPVAVGHDGDREPHGHDLHGDDHHHDRHGHGHHGDRHTHELPEGVAPLSAAGVLAIGSAGGLLPSPAAFALLVTAMAIGRSGAGLALLVAFGAGLALALTAVGVAVVYGREQLAARASRSGVLAATLRALPLVGAVIVLTGGVLLGVLSIARL